MAEETRIARRASKISSRVNRNRYLDIACAGNDALRRRVEELLAEQREMKQYNGTQRDSDDTVPPKSTQTYNKRIGRYYAKPHGRTTARIAIHKGYDLDLGRPVSIAVIRNDTATHQVTSDAVQSEVKVLASLRHSHIIPVYEVGRLENGSLFVVTAVVPCSTLQRQMWAIASRPAFAARLISTIAKTFDYIHRNGLILYDVHPGMLFLSKEDNHPYIHPFNIGLLAQSRKAVRRSRNLSKREYMSPEQLLGEPADPQSNIFALAKVLSKIIAGPNDSGMDVSQNQDSGMSLAQETPLLEYNGNKDYNLNLVFSKAFHNDKNKRYQTAGAFAKDIDDWLQQFTEIKSSIDIRALRENPRSAMAEPSWKVILSFLRDYFSYRRARETQLGDYDADFLCNEAALRIFNGINFFKGSSETHLLRWCARIARQTAVDAVRSHLSKRMVQHHDDRDFLDHIADRMPGETQHVTEAVNSALSLLSEQDRNLIMERYFLGKTFEEIANEQGCSVRTCVRRYNDIKSSLIKYLSADLGNSSY